MVRGLLRMRLKPLAWCLAVLAASPALGQMATGDTSRLPAACRPYVLPIGQGDFDPANITSTFAAPSVDAFRTQWRQRLDAPPLNPAFPHARAYARSFETPSVAYLYERVVFQADLSALSFIIRLTESTQPSIQNDARAALAFVHFQLDSPEQNQRGLALIQAALPGQGSYPAAVFWGRAQVWGSPYGSVNLQKAMGLLAQAGRVPQERASAGRRVDTLNGEELHTATLRHLLDNVPEMPYRSAYEGLMPEVQKMDRAQDAFQQQLEKSRDLEPVNQALAAIDALLEDAARLGLGADGPSPVGTGLDRLRAVLVRQEKLAQALVEPMPLRPEQADVLERLRGANEKLQLALDAIQRQLVLAQVSDRSAFPDNLRRARVLTTLQRGLSRSCSLSMTWALSRS